MKLKVSAFLILLFVQLFVLTQIVEAESILQIIYVDISIDKSGFVSIEEKVSVMENVDSIKLLIPRDVEILSISSGGEELKYKLQGYEKVRNTTEALSNVTPNTMIIDLSEITIFFPKSNEKPEDIMLKYGSSRFTSKSYKTWAFSVMIPVTAYKTAIIMQFPRDTMFDLDSLPPGIKIWVGENTLNLGPDSDIFEFSCNYDFPPDTTPPAITLQSPLNNAVMIEGTVVFQYTVEDEESRISSCRLIVEDVIKGTNDSIKGGLNQFAYVVKGGSYWGDYEWSIECVDDSHNANLGKSERRSIKVISALLIGVVVVIPPFTILFFFIRRKKRGCEKKIKKEDAEKEGVKEDVEISGGKTIEDDRMVKAYILRLLDENETIVVGVLSDLSCEVTQAYVYKTTGMPKATLSDVMKRLEDRDVIERRREGRTNWVKLKDWIFD